MDYVLLPQPVQQALRQQWLLPALTGLLLLVVLLTVWNNIKVLWLAPPLPLQAVFHAPTIVNVQQLAQDHLLGSSANMQDLPLASLGITLQGIFFDGQNRATAIIAQNSGASTVYHVDDQLAPNIIIVKILPTTVIIKHNGNLEKLAMSIQPVEFSPANTNRGLWNKS